MTKHIVALDFETSGLDTAKDYILQIGLVKFDSETFEELESKIWYIKPTVEFKIAPGAEKVTGITKEFILENGVTLKSMWPEFVDFIGDCDILTYNGNNYDIPLLYSNIKREGLTFDFNRRFYDSIIIERERHKMNLASAYKRYTGEELEGAHDALIDVKGTIAVFKGQQDVTKDDIEKEDFTLISPEGFLRRNEDGEIVFATGKYRLSTTNEICKSDPSYIRWVFETFSKETCQAIKDAWYKEHPKTN